MLSGIILSSLLNYVPQASSRLTCLRAFASYLSYVPSCLCALSAPLPYVPSCLMCLHALGALLTRFTYAHCASFSRALLALFVHVKIVLGWICSPGKTYHFQRIIKDTTNCAVFKWVKKQSWNFLSGEFF